MNYRKEYDSMGEINVPADKLWGAQTQRSLQNFQIGSEKMPLELVYGYARLKMACAKVNSSLGTLDPKIAGFIETVCEEILAGDHNKQFPLSVWQTGSGTQTNMNLNEVIANRATQLAKGSSNALTIHPNDHVNRSQSSNDTFPAAMHISALFALEDILLPTLISFSGVLQKKRQLYETIIKIGRTHLQDATPLTLDQEISGWQAMILASIEHIKLASKQLSFLAIGGTAVGTGLNAPQGFGENVCETLSTDTGKKFVSSPNKFHALTSHDQLVFASGAVKGLAADMMKIANDVRWLASGPRCGLGELTIPANEPGSSIMPGKVNPTQAEAVTMAVCQVFGNDTTIGFAASQGNFELNVFKPVIIYNFLQSVQLMNDAVSSFSHNCIEGLEPVPEIIDKYLSNSLMLVTALNPHIGYDKAAQIAKKAHKEKISLKQAAVLLNILSPEQFDEYVVPEQMIKTADSKP